MVIFGTDFDDTLYFHDGRGLQQTDADAIAHFQQQGNKFGLVSGRAIQTRPEVDRMLEGKVHFDFYVYSNGSVICDADNRIVQEFFMPESIIRELYDKYAQMGLIFAEKTGIYQTQENLFPGAHTIRSLDEIDPSQVYAVSFQHDSEQGRQAQKDNLNRTDCHMQANSMFTDFFPLETDKGLALLKAARFFQNDECSITTAAMGDSYNDMSMLKAAQTGFTFPGSPEEVKRSADVLAADLADAIGWMEKEDKKSEAFL